MLRIPVVKGNLNRALKQFKKKFRDTKVLKELRDRKQHTKKSDLRRKKKEKAILKELYKRENDE